MELPVISPLHFNNEDNEVSILQSKSLATCWNRSPRYLGDLSFYFTVRGSENIHLYLWVLKDLSWTQDWFVTGYIFGILAVLWSGFLLTHAIERRNMKEMWTAVGQVLWLSANLWWMCGELHDFNYPNDSKWYPQRTIDARHIMEVALAWLAVYYLFIKPWGLLAPSIESEKDYNLCNIAPRFSFVFRNWREYENVHILFWLGKDYGWNLANPIVWIVFLVPALLIACDFVYISLFDEDLLVEHCHYISQFLWVLANMVWAMGEIFFPDADYPFDLFSRASARRVTARWYSSWVLVASFIPILVLYSLWYRNAFKVKNVSSDSNNECSTRNPIHM